jgi:hypothetical protein
MRTIEAVAVGVLRAGLVVCPANATVIGWGSGAPNANQGYSMVYADFTITAQYKLSYPTDPIASPGTAGTLYWGDLTNGGKDDLGDPDCSVSPYCIGLGVQTALDKNGKAGGSLGISGTGGDADEAVIFTFTSPVPANSVQLLILGVNGASGSGKNAVPADFIDVYVKYAGSPTTILYSNVSPTYVPYAAPSYLNLSDLGVSSANIAALAIVESGNHTGIGQISYNNVVVPEPVTLSLIGAGLLVLGGIRRFRK